ncbi:MAG: SseB family protein [Nitrospinota bacterium]|nr:SseB family protein [Nitrospinota bacterium]
MKKDFVPENDLESALLKAKQGQMPFGELLTFVMNQVIVVLSKTVTMNEDPNKTPEFKDPLVVFGANDEPQIAAFTSLSRAKEKQKTRPEFKYAVDLQCGELFRIIADGAGLAINPNMKVGLQLNSEHVHQLKILLTRKTSGGGQSEFVLDEAFAPKNDLESVLLKAQIENTPLTSILPAIINSDLVVLAKGSNLEDPLFVSRSDGVNLLAAFSTLPRSQERQKENPDYKFAVPVTCGHLLLGLPEGTGMVINPGIRVGLVLTPEIARQIKNQIKSD